VKGIKESERKIFDIGGSQAITLPKDWVKFVEWLRKKELSEVYCAMDNVIVLAPVEKKKEVLRMLKKHEEVESDESS
jgi:virulence-associated protein VagC